MLMVIVFVLVSFSVSVTSLILKFLFCEVGVSFSAYIFLNP